MISTFLNIFAKSAQYDIGQGFHCKEDQTIQYGGDQEGGDNNNDNDNDNDDVDHRKVDQTIQDDDGRKRDEIRDHGDCC